MDSTSNVPAEHVERRSRAERRLRPTSRWLLVVALLVAAGIVLRAMWEPLLLAAWCAIVARPLHVKAAGWVGARRPAAAIVTVGISLLILTFLAGVGVVIAVAAVNLYELLQSSEGLREAAKQLVSSASLTSLDWRQSIELLRQYGGRAWGAAGSLLSVGAAVVIGTFVFVVGFYTFLVDGERTWEWCIQRAPIPKRDLRRLGSAFAETGRGLLLGIGLTALLQGGITTLVYVAFSIPQGLVLGLLTIVAALVPAVGTGLVWVPLTIVLFVTDNRLDAAIVLVTGAMVALSDSLLRPALTRYGRLEMPSFVVLVAMLGGIAAFGAGGVLIGPLVVRLSIEGLKLLRDDDEVLGSLTSNAKDP